MKKIYQWSPLLFLFCLFFKSPVFASFLPVMPYALTQSESTTLLNHRTILLADKQNYYLFYFQSHDTALQAIYNLDQRKWLENKTPLHWTVQQNGTVEYKNPMGAQITRLSIDRASGGFIFINHNTHAIQFLSQNDRYNGNQFDALQSKINTFFSEQPRPLITVAQSDDTIWNGVAVTKTGRIFANTPKFDPNTVRPGVVEIKSKTTAVPFPNNHWNQFSITHDAKHSFVNVNAIHLEDGNHLWVVDSGVPYFGAKVISHGAKLVEINLKLNKVEKVYYFPFSIISHHSYVDDVRFHQSFAYLTDAGSPGIIVLNRKNGKMWRVLNDRPSTTASKNIVVNGLLLRGPDNEPLQVNVDPLEVSPDGKWLFFQALAGPLYRVPTKYLDSPHVSASLIQAHVELWYNTNALGGTAIDAEGNLYLEDLNQSAIYKLTPEKKLILLVQDKQLHWTDAPCIANGYLWAPAAQIDKASAFNDGHSLIQWPIKIFKVKVE